jgi:hypothetical protein
MNDATLRAGLKLERIIADLFFREGWFVGGKKNGNEPSRDVDVFVPTSLAWERLEVKNEENQKDSKNLCIETHQGDPRHHSGIMTSESTVCLHYFSDARVVLYRTQSMRLWLPISGLREILFRGSDNSNGGYLVPVLMAMDVRIAQVVTKENIARCTVWRKA